MAFNHNSGTIEIVTDFFESLYGDSVGPESSIVMWSKAKGVKTLWKWDIRTAAIVAVDRAKQVDTYYQPCLHSKELVLAETDRRIASGEKASRRLEYNRGYNQTATVMPALWADIDTKEGNHTTNRDGLPSTSAEVIAVLENLAAPPTYIIDTGGGVHAYWLFSEPMELLSDEDRTNATNLSYRWQQGYLRGEMEKLGWTTLDSVYDLARVMRVPGTLNRKYDPPRDVRIVGGHQDRRYDPDEMEVFIPERIGGAPVKTDKVYGLKDFPYEDENSPTIDYMIELDRSFEMIWNGRKEYTSQSHRDMAIARLMTRRKGTTPEMIFSALVRNRRMLGADRTPENKGLRYYEKTIGLVIEDAVIAKEEKEGIDDIYDALTANRANMEVGNQESRDLRAGLLGKVGGMLGLKESNSILSIECVDPGGGHARVYTLQTSNGRRILGELCNMRSQQKFIDALSDVFLIYIKKIEGKKWESIFGLLMDLADVVDYGEDSTEEGQTRDLIRRWLDTVCPRNGVMKHVKSKAFALGLPWVNKEKVYMCPARSFERITKLVPNARMTKRGLIKQLRDIGATKVEGNRGKLPADENGVRKSYDMWLLPHGVRYWLDWWS